MKDTINNLKRVYKYGREYRLSLIIQIICCIIGVGINVIFPLISAKIIVNLTNSMFKQTIYVALVLLIISIINAVKNLIIRKNTQIFRRGTVRNIKMTLGREILKLDQKTLDENTSGAFVKRITDDTDKMASMFTVGMGKLTGFISDIGSFIAILIIDYHMFIYYFLASSILTILYYVKVKKMGKKEIELRKQGDKVAGLTSELVRGARDIKMLYAIDSFMNEYDKNIIHESELNFETRNIDINYNLIIHILNYTFRFLAIVLLVYLISENILSAGVAIALYSYKDLVLTNLMQTVSVLLEECKDFNISSDRVFAIINNEEYSKETFGNKHINNINGDFEFQNVSFKYDENMVLDNLSLKIENGKTYGIVGKSGAGKTTIFNLLCKMYNVNEGKILIDNIDINELDEESIRGNITIISQNPYIFNMSIKDNFKLVKNNITNEEIKYACHLSCLDDFIESLPDKYDTIIGEGGVNLSGGQRQRIAIARALIQDTKIILFDEATSALDNETQQNIQRAIDNLKGNYTVLIIAHRLSTIVNCDKIFYIENGKVIESGTHEELLESCDSYKNLYNSEIKEKK